MTVPLIFQQLRFDPSAKEITLDGDLPVEEFYDICREAFQHVNLIFYENPITPIALGEQVYYICSWKISGGKVISSESNRFVHGMLQMLEAEESTND